MAVLKMSAIRGEGGNDVIFGSVGNDLLFGDDGKDELYGEEGDDILLGGAGADALFGGEGNDLLWGEGGSDMLYGGAGDDRLEGHAGADVLNGGTGVDFFTGKGGNDRFQFDLSAIGESGIGAGNRDVITDFKADAEDTIEFPALRRLASLVMRLRHSRAAGPRPVVSTMRSRCLRSMLTAIRSPIWRLNCRVSTARIWTIPTSWLSDPAS